MFKRLFLIAVLTIVAVLGSVVFDAPEVAEASTGCSGFHGTFSALGTQSGSYTGQFDEGEAITISTNLDPGLGTHYMIVSGVMVGPADLSEPLSYTFPAAGAYEIFHQLNGGVELALKVYWSCGLIVGGCDVNVTLPSTAVVGEITDNAAVFSMPSADAMTDIVLTIGKTFWMDGLDSTGTYRKTLISCTWVWVEASKTGPNFDDVWNGTPLPNHTVD